MFFCWGRVSSRTEVSQQNCGIFSFKSVKELRLGFFVLFFFNQISPYSHLSHSHDLMSHKPFTFLLPWLSILHHLIMRNPPLHCQTLLSGCETCQLCVNTAVLKGTCWVTSPGTDVLVIICCHSMNKNRNHPKRFISLDEMTFFNR